MGVLSMREYMADVELLPVVVNDAYDAKIIPSNVEHRIWGYVVGSVKRPLDLNERSETRRLDDAMPRLQGCFCRWVLAPEGDEHFLRNDVHDSII